MEDTIQVIRKNQVREDRLFSFAVAAMSKIIIMTSIRQNKETGWRYELNTRAAWDMAESMMAEKERRDSEKK